MITNVIDDLLNGYGGIITDVIDDLSEYIYSALTEWVRYSINIL